jgi:hypothetical protein
MRTFEIADDVLGLVSELAKPQPFESFGDTLRRFLTELTRPRGNAMTREMTADQLLAELDALDEPGRERFDKGYEEGKRRRAPSPDPQRWALGVNDLRGPSVPTLNTWRAICDYLKIPVRGDSARRALQKWAASHRPTWPPVPNA